VKNSKIKAIVPKFFFLLFYIDFQWNIIFPEILFFLILRISYFCILKFQKFPFL